MKHETITDVNRCVVSGTVIIEHVAHKVVNKWIKCDPGLNSRSWGTTYFTNTCNKCFDNRPKTTAQLTLF